MNRFRGDVIKKRGEETERGELTERGGDIRNKRGDEKKRGKERKEEEMGGERGEGKWLSNDKKKILNIYHISRILFFLFFSSVCTC